MTSADLLALASERFVSLTTFRRSGDGVATPVWIAQDGDQLIVTTPADSGKVKRLRNDPSVTLRASGRMGGIDEDAPLIPGVATIETDPTEIGRCSEIFREKYGLEYRTFMFIESRAAGGRKERVILRVGDRPDADA